MGKSVFVFSTLATDVMYVEWLQGGADLPMQGRKVTIKGGTGVADSRIVTPIGVGTEVDEDDLPWLETVPQFQHHVKEGHIRVERKSADPEKVAADMKLRDRSAPLTPSDFENAPESVAKPSKRSA